MKQAFPCFNLLKSVSAGQMIGLVIAALLLSGCAVPGPKYLDLYYPAAATCPERTRSAGLTRFTDKRINAAKGHVGFRQLSEHNREIFVVSDQDLASTLTRVSRSFLEQNGFHVSLIPAWPITAQGVSTTPSHLTRVLTADINRFECRAEKNNLVTDMTLIIDLTFYLGTPDKKQLTIIPIVLTLTRTEWHFTRRKLETFINQSLEEILHKALPLT
ncbi:MAG: hypothetical protein ABR513_03650 [Desulfotignum sp.]